MLTRCHTDESVYDFDDTIDFSQSSSMRSSLTDVKQTAMKIYAESSFKELNAFFFFENHIFKINIDKIFWQKIESTYWNLCAEDEKKNVMKQFFFFLIEQIARNSLKKVNKFEKYNVKINIFYEDVETFKRILNKKSHETSRFDKKNNFSFDIVNTSILWLNAVFKNVKKKFDEERNKDEVRIK